MSRRMVRAALAVTALALPLVAIPAGADVPEDRRDRPTTGPSAPTWNPARIHTGRATGRHKPAARTATAAPAADVTGDGRADLVAQFSSPDSGSLRVFANNGSTTADPWDDEPAATSPRWDFADVVLFADVTGDGAADVVARDPAVANGSLWVYPNDGSGSADPWQDRFAAGTGWNIANTILAGDVDGDGFADLVVRDPAVDAGTLWTYRSSGATTSNPWTVPRAWGGTGWNLADPMLLGDITGDGHPDLAARDSAGTIFVYPHNGTTTGNHWTSRLVGATGWNGADRLALADVTGDDHADLVARDPAGALWIHPYNGAQGRMWEVGTRYPAGTGFSYARDVQPADLDGDGAPELIARVAPGSDLWTYPNDGSTTANPWPARVSAGSAWSFASTVQLGDVDGDRLLDLLVLDRSAARGTLWIYLNNGAATGDRWPVRYFGGTGWNIFDRLLVGDVTGDGLTDLVGRDPGGDLFAYPGNGSATTFPWDERSWVGSGWQTARHLALGDVDADGFADLVDLEADDTLWIFPTAGSGGQIAVPGSWAGTTALQVGHVDGSGHADLVVRDAGGTLRIHPGSAGANPWTAAPRPGGTGFALAQSLEL